MDWPLPPLTATGPGKSYNSTEPSCPSRKTGRQKTLFCQGFPQAQCAFQKPDFPRRDQIREGSFFHEKEISSKSITSRTIPLLQRKKASMEAQALIQNDSAPRLHDTEQIDESRITSPGSDAQEQR